jgi:hypothetical protein
MTTSTRLLATLLFVSLSLVLAIPSHLGPDLPSIHSDVQVATNHTFGKRFLAGAWSLVQNGNTGVSAMMIQVLSPTTMLIMDKSERNPLTTPNGNPAWAALYNMQTQEVTPLALTTNPSCSGGSLTSSGTFLSAGGNVVEALGIEQDGMASLRLFASCEYPNSSGHPCNAIYEDLANFRMLERRWYPTALRLYDGTILIAGGTKAGGFYNSKQWTSASFEYYPKKWWQANNVITPSPFLLRTPPADTFPIAFALPDGKVFLAANNQSIVYDTDYNYEIVLPQIPDGYRVSYPFTASAVLLPLIPPNYVPEVLICGGSNMNDALPESALSAQIPASNRCWRMAITEAGVAAGWLTEIMPERRVMPDMVILPNGEVIVVNGAQTGAAGYGNLADRVEDSNADSPVLSPTRYDPYAAVGSRFSKTGLPTSNISRMYHSVASLTPMGNIFIAGSNPNGEAQTTPGRRHNTEYRAEYLNPPYMTMQRPTWVNPPSQMRFGTAYTFNVTIPQNLTGDVYGLSLF